MTTARPVDDTGRAGDPVMTSDPRHIALKLVALAAALAATSTVWSAGTWSAFHRTSDMPGNSVGAGTVQLGDNDSGTSLLSLSSARPGDTTTNCIRVSYSGTAPAHVRLYGAVGGTGLAGHLTLTVTRGTFSGTPSAGSCTGFTPDATDWTGNGAGVVYSGALADFPQSSGTAIVDPVSGSADTWSEGDRHGYRFTATLQAVSAAQGKTATADFTWQAVSA